MHVYYIHDLLSQVFLRQAAMSAAHPFIAAHRSKCCFTYEVQRDSGLEVYEAVFLNIKNM